MAAVVAVRSHCEDSREHGHLQQEIPQRKIGLDDVMNAGCCVLATGRCASSCMQRDLALEKTTPLSSQVRRPKILSAFSTLSGLVPPWDHGTMRRCNVRLYSGNVQEL